MINNFLEVVTQTFDKFCDEKYTTNLREQHIAEVSFKKFSITIYYSAYEYDLGLDYCKKENEIWLDQVLQEIGCSNDQLPKYKYMSNEEVMANYLAEYIELINRYFKELSNFNIKKLR